MGNREPKMIITTGMKGIGKSNYFENKYKDYFKIETPEKNRQDKSVYKRILEAKHTNKKILLKTNHNYLKNKYNIKRILESNLDISIVIEDIGKSFNINKKSFKNNIHSKFNLKQTDVYKLINK